MNILCSQILTGGLGREMLKGDQMVVLMKLTQQDSCQNWIYMEVYGEAERKLKSLAEDQPCEDSVRPHWIFHRQCFPPFSFLTSGLFPASFHKLFLLSFHM